MRVIWKDSGRPKEYKPIKYRGYMVQGSPRGWTTTIPGDNNLYSSHYCAQNAIDLFYGDYGQRGTEKRRRCGITIISKHKETS